MNVHEAALSRIKHAFDTHERVLVAFSGGKDSGVCLNLCYQYARDTGQLSRLAVYHEDYEAGYQQTFDYIERAFDAMPEIDRYWLCLPISAACSVSMHQPRWIPWNPDEKSLWVRQPPKKPYVYTTGNIWFPFTKGTTGFQFRIDFAEHFAQRHGKTAVIVGLRQDESLSRRAIITSARRVNYIDGRTYTTIVSDRCTNYYPIHDWRTEDIWTANGRFGWDYNKLYDLFHMAGLGIHEMRTASPFHPSGQDTLKLYRAINPDMWAKMVGRVNGVNFTGIYGGTTAMGWKKITKPAHFTWKEYAHFLIDTLPPQTRDRVKEHLARFTKSWSENGYGRNPRVIKAIMDAGVDIENTHSISKLCTKPDVYEIIRIKGEWPDEIDIKDATPFRHCPNWKAVCVTIMKNDFTLTYMGLGRTKQQMARRKAVMEKYQALL